MATSNYQWSGSNWHQPIKDHRHRWWSQLRSYRRHGWQFSSCSTLEDMLMISAAARPAAALEQRILRWQVDESWFNDIHVSSTWKKTVGEYNGTHGSTWAPAIGYAANMELLSKLSKRRSYRQYHKPSGHSPWLNLGGSLGIGAAAVFFELPLISPPPRSLWSSASLGSNTRCDLLRRYAVGHHDIID